MTDAPDYKDTVFLPKTDFPMKAGLAQKEPAIAAQWEAEGLYGKLRAARKGCERFVLHDGPPYANGDIHMGHAMNKVLKDIIVRSQSLTGKDAPYTPGWDCHGLPIEWKIEEEYRKKKLNKDEVPPQEFRAQCRAYADKWVGVQMEQFKRLGIQGDWDDPYLTMKFEAEAAIVGELLKFAESGQLYRGAKPVMWSPVEKTALAEAEVEYEDVTSTQIDVAFEIVEAPNAPELVGAHAVIWTTTPWTIPTNQGIAYGEGIEYTLIEFGVELAAGPWDGEKEHRPPNNAKTAEIVADRLKDDGVLPRFRVLVANQLVNALAGRITQAIGKRDFPDLGVSFLGVITNASLEFGDAHRILTVKGSDLAGAKAKHPMSHLGGFYEELRPFMRGDFVTADTGTGLVHMAPDHGEDDFELCKKYADELGTAELPLRPVFAVQGDGTYRVDWAWPEDKSFSVISKKLLAPPNVEGTGGPICEDLKKAGALLSAKNDESTRHSYPHSWRSKAPLIYRCTPQWFIPMDKQGGQIEFDAAPLDGVGGAIAATVSGHGATLRETALQAIEDTRWVPRRSTNRIRSMVEGRPDWVISRQRAWGVPIALYVNRKTGEYLNDKAVNARIVEAFRAGGADAWFGADHQALLGNDHRLEDYEVVNDILDVWFDSGSTHAFVMEPRYGTGMDDRADLYLEGSDQHRGWFQSSLLESCGTRGRAPYKGVLTHGFALDQQGRKMSKSLGNTVDPLKVMSESGADILRMWVASTDYFDDVRIGKEVLAGSSDAYRKLRNTFRYLLGALADFDESEKVPVGEMPELERYMLHKLAELDAVLREVVEDRASDSWLEFSRYTRALNDFANIDLSAFFFDIRKDCLYCDVNPASGKQTEKRKAYRTVLDTLFHALVRYAAPIIPFTAEEVWKSRFPDADSVHMLEWPDFQALLSRHSRESGDPAATPDLDSRFRGNDRFLDRSLATKWVSIRSRREEVTETIEPYRREKTIRSSLEAAVKLSDMEGILGDYAEMSEDELAEIFIVSEVAKAQGTGILEVQPTSHHKCGRCWRHLPEVSEDGALCDRCEEILA